MPLPAKSSSLQLGWVQVPASQMRLPTQSSSPAHSAASAQRLPWAPASQVCPPGHALPHAPQCDSSVCVFAHALQLVSQRFAERDSFAGDAQAGDVVDEAGTRGGHAGQNGVRHIIARLGTPDFVRVRVGVGRPPPGFRGDVADWVLGAFDASERAELPDVLTEACAAIEQVIRDGASKAMTAVNARAGARRAP